MDKSKQQSIITAAVAELAQCGHEMTVGPACIRKIDGRPFSVGWFKETPFGPCWRLGPKHPHAFVDATTGAELADAILHELARARAAQPPNDSQPPDSYRPWSVGIHPGR